VLAGFDGQPDGLLPLAGHLGVEVDLHVGAGQRRAEIGGPLGQAVAGGHVAQLGLAAADQQQLRPEHRTVAQREPAALANGQQGTDQVLAIAHPSGDTVHDDPDRDASGHGPTP
jgi:hypothetical protein